MEPYLHTWKYNIGKFCSSTLFSAEAMLDAPRVRSKARNAPRDRSVFPLDASGFVHRWIRLEERDDTAFELTTTGCYSTISAEANRCWCASWTSNPVALDASRGWWVRFPHASATPPRHRHPVGFPTSLITSPPTHPGRWKRPTTPRSHMRLEKDQIFENRDYH